MFVGDLAHRPTHRGLGEGNVNITQIIKSTNNSHYMYTRVIQRQIASHKKPMRHLVFYMMIRTHQAQ